MPDARIYVKIDVDNAAAIAKIRATEASIASISKTFTAAMLLRLGAGIS